VVWGPIDPGTWGYGPVIGPLAVGGKQQILSLAGVDCRYLDKDRVPAPLENEVA
jgi:hypothetical protein